MMFCVPFYLNFDLFFTILKSCYKFSYYFRYLISIYYINNYYKYLFKYNQFIIELILDIVATRIGRGRRTKKENEFVNRFEVATIVILENHTNKTSLRKTEF